MKFLIQDPTETRNFSLVYRNDDYSFDIEPLQGSGDSSIMINMLQLEIDFEGRVMYAWGYCPLIQFEEVDEMPREYAKGELIALLSKPPTLGISYRINEKESWPIYINKKDGWVCIGNPKMRGKQLVEFAPSCIASMENDEIVAVWLHPTSLPQL